MHHPLLFYFIHLFLHSLNISLHNEIEICVYGWALYDLYLKDLHKHLGHLTTPALEDKRCPKSFKGDKDHLSLREDGDTSCKWYH